MGNSRVVVVTGGASGIGRAVADAFHQDGDRVVIADVNAAAAREAAAELGASHQVIDISDPASVGAGIAAITASLGPIEVLVNGAGLVAGEGLLTDLPVDVFDTVARINFRGTFLMTQAVGAHMVESATAGAIVNITSIGARQPTPGLGHYEATKAAVEALTRSAAIELAGHGIRVNAVAPGPVLTPMTAGSMDDDEMRRAWEERIPLGRIAAVGDIAPSVLFLAGAGAAHITGMSLQIDGGQLLV